MFLRRNDEQKFQVDLMNIARTTLSSKLLTHHKDHFARLAVEAVMRLKGSGNLEAIHVIKKLGGSMTDSYLDEGVYRLLVIAFVRARLRHVTAALVPRRLPAGQEDRSEPAQEDRERQHPHRQHRHGHGQDQGTASFTRERWCGSSGTSDVSMCVSRRSSAPGCVWTPRRRWPRSRWPRRRR